MRTTRHNVTTVALVAALVALPALVFAGSSGAAAAAARKTTTTLALGTSYSGVRTELAARVRPTPSGGVVTITADGKTLAGCSSLELSSGLARCTAFFATGRHSVKAVYSGNSSYAGSTGAAAKTVSRGIGKVVGGVGSCTTSKGALVAVDFERWNGPIVRGCGGNAKTGLGLMHAAGFETTGTTHDGPAFVCRIANATFQKGIAYPTSSQDKCVNTPPVSKYWSFWTAAKSATSWSYSKLGAASDHPANGEVEAWTYGATSNAGTSGQPSFTPAQIRAGLSSSTAHEAAPRGARKVSAAGSARHANVDVARDAPDLAQAVGYLTSSANLVDGTHYEPFGGGFTDYGLTMDGALALAAAGTDDATLKKVTRYVEAHGDTYTGVGTPDANSGAIAKEAVLAEVTGNDPRSFHGHDLIGALESLLCTGADANGCAGAGNFRNASSTFSQALAVIALLRAGDISGASPAVDFLTDLQHSDGSFPSVLPASDSDVDSTAMAAQALASATLDSKVTKALSWLSNQQEGDGGFPGASGDSTNSAALAVQALSLGGTTYRSQIDKGMAFLAVEQNSDGGFDVAAGTDGSDLRASAQAVSGAIGTPLNTLADDIVTTRAQPDVQAGADYLTSKLTDGTHIEFDGGFGPNYGGTADIAIALAAAGEHDVALARIVSYLAEHVDAYVDPNGKQQYPGPYTGAAGKLATLAEITGQDPTDFGGANLLEVLTDHVCTTADNAGTCTAPGDFYQAFSTVSQSLGVLALARAGHTVPAGALARLLSLQCSDGGFSSTLVTDGQQCTSEVDTTGFAVQALAALPGDQDAANAVHDGVVYLRGQQQHDGGWNGAAGESSNSTALAIQGLLAAPASAEFDTIGRTSRTVKPAATRSDPAVKNAQAFLADLQNTDGGFDISTAADGSDIAATTQSVAAAAYSTLDSLREPIDLTGGGSGGGSGSSGNGGSGGSGGGSESGGSESGDSTPGGNAAGDDSLADTGVHSNELLGYAGLSLLVGSALAVAGRRRSTRRGAEVTPRDDGITA